MFQFFHKSVIDSGFSLFYIYVWIYIMRRVGGPDTVEIDTLVVFVYALTNFLRPSVDIDFGLSRGRPRALLHTREAVTPEK